MSTKCTKYLVIDLQNEHGYLITDTTEVASTVGVHRNTIINWMNVCEYKCFRNFVIVKSPTERKSPRGGTKVKNTFAQ